MAALATPQALDPVGMLLRMDETPTESRLEFTPANMKLRREQLRLSQTKLGQMLEPAAAQRTIVHWESGDYRVKSPRKEQIAEILGLITGDEPATGPQGPEGQKLVRIEVKMENAMSLFQDAMEDIRSLLGS